MRRGGKVGEERKRDAHEWDITRGGDLDFEPHGLWFLLGFNQDVAACWASLGFLRMERYS